MKKLTKAQQSAMEWLHDRGGSGVLDQHNRLCARGESLSMESCGPLLRLVAVGLVTGGGGRIFLTSEAMWLLRARRTEQQLGLFPEGEC